MAHEKVLRVCRAVTNPQLLTIICAKYATERTISSSTSPLEYAKSLSIKYAVCGITIIISRDFYFLNYTRKALETIYDFYLSDTTYFYKQNINSTNPRFFKYEAI